jgi:hypothetical protein
MQKYELAALLTKYKVDINLFGVGKAKTLDHLLKEVNSGEAELTKCNGELLRRLSVLNITVLAQHKADRYRLIEDRQIFKDGRERRRQLSASLSEKLQEDEGLLAACKRALKEEIGVSVYTHTTNATTSVERVESPSFPGITTEYNLSHVEVLIDPSEYRKDGYTEEQKDKTTYFVWLKVN